MSRYSPVSVLVLAVLGTLLIVGCGGGTSTSAPATSGGTGGGNGGGGDNGGVAVGQLSVSAPSMNFGSVTVGSSTAQTGMLTAATAAVAVTSGSVTGPGYTLSGLSYPLTLAAGKSASFTITFAPQVAGAASGSLSFVSNASNSPTSETLSGTGSQAELHSVALSWDASASQVVGYNVYRGITTGGPYTLLTSSLQPTTTFVDNTVVPGTTYYYVATAVGQDTVESVYSNQITAVVP
jgi:hypothetical protein